MNDATKPDACALHRSGNGGAAQPASTEGYSMGYGAPLCGDRPLPAIRPTSAINERNETLAKLDRMRKGYRDTGKLMEAKAIERGIEVLREGWK